MRYLDVVRSFEDAGYRVARIENEHGCLACLSAAARVIAIAPDLEAENFLYNPVEIMQCDKLRQDLYCTAGAPGGDRLWIAPENPYFCEIELADYVDHSHYFRPKSIDPGAYAMTLDGCKVNFEGDISVLNKRTEEYSQMQVERSITQLKSPYANLSLATASYRIEQNLVVSSGLAGLWNIAQIPVGGVIVLPIKEPKQPSSYFKPPNIAIYQNACAFYISGDSHSKIGYDWEIATGDSSGFYWCDGKLNMIYRQYPVVDGGYYCDLPCIDAPPKQVVQAWDGLGFGELEYHSAAAGYLAGSQKVMDCSTMHCIRGESNLVLDIASNLLGMPVKELSKIVSYRAC